MNKLLILLIILTVAMAACKSQEANNGSSTEEQVSTDDPLVPAWLDSQMQEWQDEGYTAVSAYQWQGDTVYLAVPPCCDRFSELYSSTGNLLCHPSGGITGKGDGKCAEFRSEAALIKELAGNQE